MIFPYLTGYGRTARVIVFDRGQAGNDRASLLGQESFLECAKILQELGIGRYLLDCILERDANPHFLENL